jgi:hypothetical protein
MASQVPAGALVDAMRSKRMAAAAAIAAIGVSALAIALWPNFLAITAAEALHSFASAILGRRSPRSRSFWSMPGRLANGSAATHATPRSATLWQRD